MLRHAQQIGFGFIEAIDRLGQPSKFYRNPVRSVVRKVDASDARPKQPLLRTLHYRRVTLCRFYG